MTCDTGQLVDEFVIVATRACLVIQARGRGLANSRTPRPGTPCGNSVTSVTAVAPSDAHAGAPFSPCQVRHCGHRVVVAGGGSARPFSLRSGTTGRVQATAIEQQQPEGPLHGLRTSDSEVSERYRPMTGSWTANGLAPICAPDAPKLPTVLVVCLRTSDNRNSHRFSNCVLRGTWLECMVVATGGIEPPTPAL